jgi:hypothetical protein
VFRRCAGAGGGVGAAERGGVEERITFCCDCVSGVCFLVPFSAGAGRGVGAVAVDIVIFAVLIMPGRGCGCGMRRVFFGFLRSISGIGGEFIIARERDVGTGFEELFPELEGAVGVSFW